MPDASDPPPAAREAGNQQGTAWPASKWNMQTADQHGWSSNGSQIAICFIKFIGGCRIYACDLCLGVIMSLGTFGRLLNV